MATTPSNVVSSSSETITITTLPPAHLAPPAPPTLQRIHPHLTPTALKNLITTHRRRVQDLERNTSLQRGLANQRALHQGYQISMNMAARAPPTSIVWGPIALRIGGMMPARGGGGGGAGGGIGIRGRIQGVDWVRVKAFVWHKMVVPLAMGGLVVGVIYLVVTSVLRIQRARHNEFAGDPVKPWDGG